MRKRQAEKIWARVFSCGCPVTPWPERRLTTLWRVSKRLNLSEYVEFHRGRYQ